MEDPQKYIDQGIEMAIQYGPKLALAIVTLFIGLIVIGSFSKFVKRSMEAKGVEPSLSSFVLSLSTIILKLLLAITVAGMVGIEVTSFIAIFGAAGLAIGMALSGTLQNFAGGVMILLFKPFKVGDVIEAQGYTGSVREIQIFNTILKTPDNKTIIIPNAPLSSNSMVNYSTEATRRVDISCGIGYEDDIDKAKGVLQQIVDADERILRDPEPFIAVSELADSSVNFVVRSWVNAENYWPVFFHMQETVKKEFDRNAISIPYPQQDLHIPQFSESASALVEKAIADAKEPA